MTARLDLDEVLTLVSRYAVELTNGRAGAIAMREADGSLRLVSGYGLDEEGRERLVPLLDAVAAQLLDERSARRSDAAALGERLGGSAPASPTAEQVLTLPLVMYDQVVGVLFVLRSGAAALFTPVDTQLLAAFANQAAIAIQNANLYAEMALQTDELRNLYDFSLGILAAPNRRAALQAAAEHAAEIGPSDWSAILTADERGEAIVDRVAHGDAPEALGDRLAVLDEPSRSLLRHELPVVLQGSHSEAETTSVLREAGFRSAVGIPIRGTSRALGAIWVASVQPDRYRESHLRLLITFAQYLGLALDKFNLLERLAARERQLAAIVEYSPAGMLLLDADGRIIMQNPVLRTLTGWQREALSGREASDLIQLEDANGRPVALLLPQDGSEATSQGYLRRRDGSRGAYVHVSVTALVGTGSVVDGFVATVVDLTAYRETESAKSAFLAGLSHELKTPLSLIRGFAETLRYPEMHQDEQVYQEALDVILAETDHLTAMVNQLLMAARLQAHALALDLDEVAVGALVRDLVDEFRRAYPDRVWQLDVAELLPPVLAELGRLREVFHNLLSNAVKYSNPRSLIRVVVKPTRTGVCINVIDEGLGIAPEDQQRLFQRFFRASDRGDGTGLGLYMSKAIVEAHGGTIRVESEPGRGSTFTVELPSAEPVGEV